MASVRRWNLLLKRYYKSPQWISDPVQVVDQEHLKPTLFKKYAQEHLVSWLGLAAVAFQDFPFDPTLGSRVGAVSLMQIRPRSAAEVGVVGIEVPEKNVEAAARYFDLLAERYFNESGLDLNDRVASILASYNGGSARIQRLRRQAAEQGVDPNRWFGQMEALVLQEVGCEPVAHVSNVAKYYLCLSRILLTAEERASEGLDLRWCGLRPVRLRVAAAINRKGRFRSQPA